MQLSVSCRIAEGFLSKEEASMSLKELADLAVAAGHADFPRLWWLLDRWLPDLLGLPV